MNTIDTIYVGTVARPIEEASKEETPKKPKRRATKKKTV